MRRRPRGRDGLRGGVGRARANSAPGIDVAKRYVARRLIESSLLQVAKPARSRLKSSTTRHGCPTAAPIAQTPADSSFITSNRRSDLGKRVGGRSSAYRYILDLGRDPPHPAVVDVGGPAEAAGVLDVGRVWGSW